MEKLDNKTYYLLYVSIKKHSDCINTNPNFHINYYTPETIFAFFDMNNIFYKKLVGEDTYKAEDIFYVIAVADACLEERILNLIDKSVFKIMMCSKKDVFEREKPFLSKDQKNLDGYV